MPISPNQPAAITRYFAVGTTQVLMCPSIADKANPTFAELDAGTELTRDIADLSGWATNSNFIDVPDMVSRFTGKIPGRITAEDSSLTLYADEDRGSGDARDLLPRDTEGYIVFADGGLASAVGDVFHVKVGSSSPVRSLDDAAKVMVSFAILDEPAEGVTLPQS
jgi:hypothetical protein